ncbi:MULTISPECIES: Crp/Fnr family transcriptional regulator [Flavobacterium]|uniref:Crp/Fnr family transcriptional regulator n=1 Tax=Flavobacterium jumunjinense TaxID=998845 RepID=A0ABV5GK28_9FLAO|nr:MULTISPECIES: Crp/Fnr family transcriptional regulator [Flavobacterium]
MKDHLLKYGNFNKEEVNAILSHFETKEYKKKEFLLQTGHISNQEYFIIKGCIRCFVIDYNGKEHNILFGTENHWIGDLQSFIQENEATYNIQALENTTVLTISKEKWNHLLETYPSFSRYSITLYQNAFIKQQQRIIESFTLTAEQRFQNLITKFPHLLQRISQKHIASYLGITPEFLSLLRKK